jgi:GNAT superfamily N-acetyltransferase
MPNRYLGNDRESNGTARGVNLLSRTGKLSGSRPPTTQPEVKMEAQLGMRRALSEDRGTLISIISLAFASDPLWSRALAVAGGRTDHQIKFWELFVDGALRNPTVWLTNANEAASLWVPPGGTELSEEQQKQLVDLAHEHLGTGAEDFFELLNRFESAHPHDEPHYYLSLLGTHPDHRGKGIGMALVAGNLEWIDAEGMPAYLESSNPANNPRYERLGFRVTGEFSYPGGGPVVTTMWRDPRDTR